MTNNKGITMISLTVYIAITMILTTLLSMISTHFYKNIKKVEYQDEYALEFNKFNMFFVDDVKNNHFANVEKNKIIFENGNIYEWKEQEKAIYKNDKKICNKVNIASFTLKTEIINNTTKQILTVNLNIGKQKNYTKTIDYVLKYW